MLINTSSPHTGGVVGWQYTLESLLHFWKAYIPIFVIPLGMVIVVRELQPRKAIGSIAVTLPGIFIFARLLQPEKIECLIVVIPSGILICAINKLRFCSLLEWF